MWTILRKKSLKISFFEDHNLGNYDLQLVMEDIKIASTSRNNYFEWNHYENKEIKVGTLL